MDRRGFFQFLAGVGTGAAVASMPPATPPVTPAVTAPWYTHPDLHLRREFTEKVKDGWLVVDRSMLTVQMPDGRLFAEIGMKNVPDALQRYATPLPEA